MNWKRGHLRPGQSERFFAFLAHHGSRFHTWVLGGSHLVLIVGWDTQGKRPVSRADG